ncbi:MULTISPECIES: hypothetical protein [Burkholderia cepacia complex]|uniref:Uncharacterized protein n=1 Tax=Burkholderia orbicola (strain MC0-3) TaxID=406425 RepID=B1JV68_BURO0|nr:MULTISPECIES: hypothetical protein [Burkholderia cepacia complex]ACA91368.1 conserved hypothetical protein [Burkholderia orbicola MC0-3]
MMPVDANPFDFKADFALIAQARTVHDTATLNLSDYYTANQAPSWAVAELSPKKGSGGLVSPGVMVQVGDKTFVQPEEAGAVVQMKGVWRAVAKADASVPAGRDYAWIQPQRVRMRSLSPDDFYSPFISGGTVVFQWDASAPDDARFVATRMIFPAWQQDVADAIKSAPQLEAELAKIGGGRAALDTVDRLLASGNDVSSILAFRALLRVPDPEFVATHAETALKTTDVHKLSIITYLSLAASQEKDRARLLEVLKTTIDETTDANRLLAVAYGAFAVSVFDRRDREAVSGARNTVRVLRQRTLALHVAMQDKAPWSQIFMKMGLDDQ